MTENERLRALLAEAQRYARHVCVNGTYGPFPCECGLNFWLDKTSAALAEPAQDYEARAEVERARSKGFTEGHAAGRQAAFDGEVTNADIQRAFQRGAEAMREAAALEVRGYSVTVTDPLGRRVKLGADGLGALADSIRAMPIPEDKP